MTSSCSENLTSPVLLSCSCESCNLAFDNGEIDATDSGRLSCAIDACDGRLLQFVHGYSFILDLAAKQAHEFQIRNQMETARQIVAFDLERCRSVLENNTAQT